MSWKKETLKFANSDSNSEDDEPVGPNVKFASETDTSGESDLEDLSSLPLTGIHCETDSDDATKKPIALTDNVRQTFCNKHCVANCGIKIASLSDNQKAQISTVFEGSKIEFKRKLLSHLQTQENIGIAATSVCFAGQKFCPKAFSLLSHRSEYLVKTVIKDKLMGTNRHATLPRFERFSRFGPFLRRFRGARGGLRPLGEMCSTQWMGHICPNLLLQSVSYM